MIIHFRYTEYLTLTTDLATELTSELSTLVSPVPSSDLDIINQASLHYAKKVFTSSAALAHHLTNRNQLEEYIDGTFDSSIKKISNEEEKWFYWHRGLLSDQDIVLLACGAEHQAPLGKSNISNYLIQALSTESRV